MRTFGDPIQYIDPEGASHPICAAILGPEMVDELDRQTRNPGGRHERVVRQITICTDPAAEHWARVDRLAMNGKVRIPERDQVIEYAVQADLTGGIGNMRTYKLIRTSALSRTRPNYDPEAS